MRNSSSISKISNKKITVRAILIKYSILMITFFVVILSTFNYWYSTNVLINSTKTMNETLLYTINENLKEIFNESETLYRLISENEKFIEALEMISEDFDSILKYKSINIIKPAIFEVSNYNTDILEELVIFINDDFFTSNNNFDSVINQNENFYKYLRELGTREVDLLRLDFSNDYKGNQLERFKNNYVLVRQIYSKDNQNIGKVIFFLDQTLMNKLINQHNFTIIDSDKNILIDSNDQTIDISEDNINNWLSENNKNNYFSVINDKEFFVSYTDMDMYDWKMINLVSAEEFSKGILKLREYTTIIILLTSLFTVGLIYLLSNKFTKKLKVIIGTFNSYPSDSKRTVNLKHLLIGKYGSQMSFLKKIQLFFCIIVLTPLLLISITNYLSIKTLIKNQNLHTVSSILSSNTYRLNNLMDRYNRITKYMVTNPIIQEFLVNQNRRSENDGYLIIKEEIRKEYIKVFKSSDYFHEIQLFDLEGKLVYSTNILLNMKSITKEVDDKKVYIAPKWKLSNNQNNNSITIDILRSSIGLKTNAGKHIGDCNLVIDELILENIFKVDKFNEKNLPLEYYVVNESDQIISSNRKSQIGEIQKNKSWNNLGDISRDGNMIEVDKGKILMGSNLNYSDWKIFYLYDTKGIHLSIKRVVYFSCGLMAFCILFIVFFTKRKVMCFALFFEEINHGLDQMIESDFKIQLYRNKGDELDYLAEGFNRMAEKLDTLVEEVYKSKLKEKELELRSLQLQINPHFLYNTLENINAMVDMGDERACHMILLLSEFFRKGVNKGINKFRIRDEIEYTKVYLEIHKIRFGNRLEITWDYNDHVICYSTLNFILQPIIENSIKHGLSKINGIGKISIRIYETDGKVNFIIQDNGVGMDADRLIYVREILAGKTISTGIGLLNVQERIKLYYGDSYGLTVYSAINEGTSFEVSIPAIND